MTRLRFPSLLTLIAAVGVLSVRLPAQTNCNEGAGPLTQDQPQGIGAADIIKRFSALESEFKDAQTHYSYTMEVSVQTLIGQDIDGEFRRLSDISYLQGRRMEHVIFAPQSTLRRIGLSKQDFEDLDRSPFVLTTEDLPQYSVMYAGQQKVDLLNTYVFDVAPKQIVRGKRYFQGKVWVETRDLAVVKSCGKTVPEEDPEAKKKRMKKKRRMPGDENVSPTLVTYREEFEHKYWFPVYVRSDDLLHFSYGDDVHLREVIKYTKYKRADADSRTVSVTQP
ncbi:MAG TPA: hypothetical protein VJA94_00980 [Candidatus Angelobacter sp.]